MDPTERTPGLGEIGRYRVVRELGRGGMGVVVEAHDPELDRRVAIKQVLGAHDPELLLRFAREAELLAQVRHPGVVRVHEVGRAAAGPYVVTELIEGEPLDALLGRGPLDEEAARRLVLALCDAVGALHARGIVHRDLKPSNVIVRPDGSPVLLDFGLARELDGVSLTQTGTLLGTPAYMAPEQARGSKELDARVDVYGLGALLYAVVTGRAPFGGPTPYAVLQAVLEREPDLTPVPPGLREAVAAALAKDPRSRPQDVAAVAMVLQGATPSAGRRRRYRAPAAALAAAVAVAVGLPLLLELGEAPRAGDGPARAPVPRTAPPSPPRSQPGAAIARALDRGGRLELIRLEPLVEGGYPAHRGRTFVFDSGSGPLVLRPNPSRPQALQVLQLAPGANPRRAELPLARLTAAAWDPSRRTLWVGGMEQSLWRIRWESEPEVPWSAAARTVRAIAVSPDGARVAIATFSRLDVHLLETGRSLVTVERRLGTGGGLLYSPDGRALLQLGLHQRSEGGFVTALLDSETLAPVAETERLFAQRCGRFVGDAIYLGSDTGRLLRCDSTLRPLEALDGAVAGHDTKAFGADGEWPRAHQHLVQDMAAALDGRLLMSISSKAAFEGPGEVRVWDLRRGTLVAVAPCRHDAAATAVATCPAGDGELDVLVAHHDGLVAVWRLKPIGGAGGREGYSRPSRR